MDITELDRWYSEAERQAIVAKLILRVGLTRVRAEYFVRLWVYLLVKQNSKQIKPPLSKLEPVLEPVSCSVQEIADLFYADQDRGSNRSAGMILAKLVALRLIQKTFDGNSTQISIPPIPELFTESSNVTDTIIDQFDPRCDAIPVANMLAQNYNWMHRNKDAVPHRILQLLRHWSQQYNPGMRVLRRSDNHNPVGFYVLYPTAKVSEAHFFNSPSKGSHLSSMAEIDPFIMAEVGDLDCVSVFIRSWMIDTQYISSHQQLFLKDAQKTVQQMQTHFPNICDLHTLIIHPSYEEMALNLGFQKTIQDSRSSVYWMYLPVDRFLTFST